MGNSMRNRIDNLVVVGKKEELGEECLHLQVFGHRLASGGHQTHLK